MFKLETALAAWRRSLESNHTFHKDDLDELEQHLRDQIAALTRQGLSGEAAYERALAEMGDYATAEGEYRKVYWGKLHRQRRLGEELAWRLSMVASYVKTAQRNLLRKKGYTFLNLAGLTLGMTCCLLLFQYVAFEYSFDAFNTNGASLYRVTQTTIRNGEEPNTSALSGYALGPALVEAAPEVVRFTRLHPDYGNAVLSNPARPEQVFEEERVYYADSTFLRMFSYPLLTGDSARALAEPGTLLLSASTARKYFGAEDPVGQALHVTGWISGTFRVGGVFRDVPPNSHLQFDVLLSMADLLQKSGYSDPASGWNWFNFTTYVQLRPGADPAEAARKFTEVFLTHQEDRLRETHTTVQLDLQPLRDIHLNADVFGPKVVMGSYRTVYFFTLIGLVTLLIALVNYVNLATARALDRAREVGIRKVVGAYRGQLITQFLLESALTNLIAFVLAAACAAALRPVVNRLASTQLPEAVWMNPWFWGAFLATLTAGTLLAGLYPAFVLSSFRPVSVLKGKAGSLATRLWLRRGLVVLQFAASVALVAGTAVVYAQLTYMRNMDLGIDLEQILTVPSPRILPEGMQQQQAIRTFTDELRQLPAVRQIATSSTVPGQGFQWYTSSFRQLTADPSTSINGAVTWIDSSFASLYGLELVAGQTFRHVPAVPAEGEPVPVILNETAVRALGFETTAAAVEGLVEIGGTQARIVGVFRDFNWSSAHEARENTVFAYGPDRSKVSLKVHTENLPETLAAIERLYTTLFPGNPFRYSFVDERFAEQYRNDQRFATLFTLFAALAITIACLGLFGLASLTAQQRTKEIGVRKVLGASLASLVALLSTDFLKLVVVAIAIAAPVAYFTMERWLEGFAYRIEIGPGVFLLAGLLALLIAFLTVSYQSIRAALADPVKSLRYE